MDVRRRVRPPAHRHLPVLVHDGHADDMDGTRDPADVHHALYGAVAYAEYTAGTDTTANAEAA
ncbi:hypothetical protein AB0I69_28085 [Streptomyces sp. NPDC050508]|uniref:hypothetical protein n=1 Tax=Streptomyces sp. NPDC050508 TaxID=3155405 RepID=UPI003434E4D0